MDGPTPLDEALAAGDASATRRLLAELPGDRERRDVVFATLARASSDSDLAVELLVEAVDRSGLPRAAAATFLVSEDAVEEVSQEVLLAIATSAGAFDGRSSFSTWVHAIARHRAVDHLRRHRAASPLDDEPGPVQRISSLIASRATVDQLLTRLPDDYRHAVALRDVQQLPYDEVAGRLGCSESTARTRVARGRALAARMLDGEVE